MSASVKEDVNTYVKNDRVKFNEKNHFLFGSKGTVVTSFDVSVEIKMDDGLTVITSYKKLKKLKKKVKKDGKSKESRTSP